MNKRELIDFLNKLNPDFKYTKEEMIVFANNLKEENVENTIGKILTMFMIDDNTLFDINDVNRILKVVLEKITQERS